MSSHARRARLPESSVCQVLRTMRRGCHHPGMSDVAPVTTAPAEIPLRPQDEVECRRCEVHCDRVVYPARLHRAVVPVRLRVRGVGAHVHGLHAEGVRRRDRSRSVRRGRGRRDGFGAVMARGRRCRCARRRSRVLRAPRGRGRLPEPRVLRGPAREPGFRVFAQIGDLTQAQPLGRRRRPARAVPGRSRSSSAWPVAVARPVSRIAGRS